MVIPDGPKDQTSDVQLHIGESLDSGFGRAATEPGMTKNIYPTSTKRGARFSMLARTASS